MITIASAVYQRVTGPTYPLDGQVKFAGEVINFEFGRSHDAGVPQKVEINIDSDNIEGFLVWKRYKTDDSLTYVKLKRKAGNLTAELPGQPPAGKLRYYVKLQDSNEKIRLPKEEDVVTRFKGVVPSYILIPHIIAMFGTMLLSTRTGIEALRKNGSYKKLTYWTIGFLIAGGMILGPITQYYAFGAFWTGFPFGTDLTDNKTLLALIGWLIALWALWKSQKPRFYIIGASILLLVIFLIPHSVMGSELDYEKLDKQKQTNQVINMR